MSSQTQVEALISCAAVCTDCASHCLTEGPAMQHCMQLSLQCAQLCQTLVQFIALNSTFIKQLSVLCCEVCQACARECSRHTDTQHCRQCMNACMDCATICNGIAVTL